MISHNRGRKMLMEVVMSAESFFALRGEPCPEECRGQLVHVLGDGVHVEADCGTQCDGLP